MQTINVFDALEPTSPILQFLTPQNTSKPIASEYKEFRKQLLILLNKQFNKGADIYASISLNTCIIDALLKNIWHHYDIQNDEAALVAIGGYGRRELFPESDIDIMIVLQENTGAEVTPKIEAFLTFLWDINLPIAQCVRTPKECLSEAKNDVTVMTSLIEHFLLAGNQSLYLKIVDLANNHRIWPSKKYFKEKLLELESRHSKFGDTSNHLEPNVKENPGGLRDIHTLRWLTNRHFKTQSFEQLVENGFLSPNELNILQNTYKVIAKVRYALHLHVARGEDRLLFDYQYEVASLLGFSNKNRNSQIEEFMQTFYRASNQLSTLSEIIISRLQSRIFPTLLKKRAKKINTRFQSRGNALESIKPDIFTTTPSAILELFNLLQTHENLTGPSDALIQQILENLTVIDEAFRNDPHNCALFLSIINNAKINSREVRRMAQLGVLGKYWPSFDAVTGRMQFDLYHIYTVEQHTLSVFRNACEFSDPSAKGEFETYHDIFIQTPKAIILYLAALFHDIAKGRGGDHSTLGEDEAKEFCTKHDLGTYDANLVGWLVKNHLVMSMTAQHRDIDDPTIVQEFAENVGNMTRLNYLYLLTIADIRGTNPNLWNSWRSSLLAELYQNTARVLRRGLDSPIRREELIKEVKDSAIQKLTKLGIHSDNYQALWDELEGDYFLRHSDEEVVRHTQAILNHQTSDEVVVNIHQYSARGATEIFVYCNDRNHLFAHITTTLAKLGLSVVHARIITSKKGHALDTFLVLDNNGRAIKDEKQCEFVARKLAAALENPEQIVTKLTHSLSRRVRELQVPVEIQFDEIEEGAYTTLELKSPDFSGLLACIGSAFIDCSIAVHNARITTLGERAHNIFQISNLDNSNLSEEQKNILAETIRGYLQQPKQIALAV